MKEIKKFNIQNIGSFLQFNWDDNFPPKKDEKGDPKENVLLNNNIFYGDNGNGKSTLVKIFKYLNGNSDTNLNKHWNDEITEQSLELSSETIEYNLESTELNDKFIIFDKQFIKDNVGDVVFGDEATQSNKNRGQNIITLGGFNRKERVLEKYNQIIADLEGKNTKLLELITIWGEKINAYLKNSKKISSYKSALEEINKLDGDDYKKQIREKDKRFTELNEIIKSFQDIQVLKELSKINEIEFNKEIFERIFRESFIGVDFLYYEKQYIQELVRITNEKELDKCLFCEQKIKNGDEYIDRIEKLSNAFSTKEKEISDNLTELKKIIIYLKQDDKEIESIHINNQLNYANFRKFDSSFIYDETFRIDLSQELVISLEKLLTEIIEKNNVKSQSKIIDLQILDNFIKDLNSKIINFNKNIESINLRINQLKKVDIESNKKERTILEIELNELQNKYFIKNNLETIKIFLDDYKKHEQNKKNIEKLKIFKGEYRKKLSEEFNIFSQEYGTHIGEVLKELNSSIQLDKYEVKNGKSEYSQGAGRYGFEIHYKNINIISDLSEGEKRAIALSYFFAEIKKKIEDINKLEEDKKIAKGRAIGEINNSIKILKHFFDSFLVLDDPAVDFDIGHKKIISDFIADYSKYFKQCFIFSHDSLFVDYLKNSFDNYGSGKYKYFWIYKTKGVSNIVESDYDVFSKYIKDLEDFLVNGVKEITELYVLNYKLRFCIERIIKKDVLGFPGTSVSGLINHIGGNEKFQRAKEKKKELQSLYNFCNHNGSHFSDVEGGKNALEKMITDFFDLYKFINDIKSI